MKDGLGLSPFDYRRIKIQQKINNFLSSKFMAAFYTLHFGFSRTIALLGAKNNRLKWLDCCYRIICEDFKDFLEGYRFNPPTAESSLQNRVWVCWLQGEENMPAVVRECIKSIKGNVPQGTEVVLITAQNLREYVDFPDYIYRYIKNGRLTLTHFSDIIRMALLSKYGGLWIDSTVFVSSQIPRAYLEKNLYSIQPVPAAERSRDLYYGGVTSFLVGGKTDCALFDFCLRFFLEYQKKYDFLIDVHLINIAYRLAYEKLPTVKRDIEDIGVNNRDMQALYKMINKPYNEEEWSRLTEKQIFHKLNWRTVYCDYAGERQTFFKYICDRQKR